MAGAQPTQYTCCAVSQTITITITERDTNDIVMELDPGVSKRGYFKNNAYVHGYKNKTTAKGNIIKIPDNTNINMYNQIEICSCRYFCWNTNSSTLLATP